MLVLILGCETVEPGESATTEDSGVSGQTSGYHLLISGQSILADEDGLGVFETDEAGTTTWAAPLQSGTGGFGAVRAESRETALAWVQIGEEFTAGVMRVDAEGNVLQNYDSGTANAPTFPHGITEVEGKNIIVGDGWNGDILCIDPDGNLVWRYATPSLGYGAVPSGLRVFDVGGRPLLVATLLGEGEVGTSVRFDQVVAWWVDGSLPELAWAFPPTPDSSVLLWVHGPQQIDDGTFLVSSAGLGQIIHLDKDGIELERTPPTDAPYRFAFPRDAVMLADGDLLVMDATELLLVHDPFGDYSVEPMRELLFGYSLDLLDCAQGGCIGGSDDTGAETGE